MHKLSIFLKLGILFSICKFYIDSLIMFNNIPNILSNGLVIISTLLFIFHYVLYEKNTIDKLLKGALFLFMALISTYFVKEYGLFIALLITFLTLDTNSHDFIKYIYIYNLVIFLVVILQGIILTLVGFYPCNVKNTYIIMTFGFNHQNVFAGQLIWLILCRMYLKQYVRLLDGMVYFIIFILGYFTTGSDALVLIGLILFLCIIYTKLFPKSKIFKKMCALSFFVLGMFIMVGIYSIYSRNSLLEFYKTIDTYFTGRIGLGAKYLDILSSHKFSIIGQYAIRGTISWDPVYNLNGITIDGLYISLFIQYGIVWFVIISFGFYRSVNKADNFNAIFFLMFSIYSLCEVHCLSVVYAFPIYLCFKNIFESNKVYRKSIYDYIK